MDIERERGITIKAQNVRVHYRGPRAAPDRHPRPRGLRLRGQPVAGRLRGGGAAGRRLPGHPGPDPGQLLPGHRARPRDRGRCSTRSTCRRPTPSAAPAEIEQVLGLPARTILRISAKTGEGVDELLDAIIDRIPPPTGDRAAPLRALIFDSSYDQYRGVVSSIRVVRRHAARPTQRAPLHAGRRRSTTSKRSGSGPPSQRARGRARPGRGRLPDRRDQGRRRGPVGRDGDRRRRARPPSPWPATGTPSPWCSAASTRSTATSCPSCATPWTSSSSTTPASPSSPSRPTPWASGSAAASSACCTWRSSGSASSASSTSRSSPPPRRWPTGPS